MTLTQVLRMGVAIILQTFFTPVLKTCSQGVKLFQVPLSSSFPVILLKKIEPTTSPWGRVSFQSWEVGEGVGESP